MTRTFSGSSSKFLDVDWWTLHFDTMRLFSKFFDILEHIRFFRFFCTMRLFKIVILHLTLGFLNTSLPIFFFNTIRNLNVISGVKRYIRIFDVIPKYSFTEEEAEVRKQVLAFVPAAISELLERFPSTKGFLWVELFCEVSIKKRHEHILKILHFLSFRYIADFGRSRLVYFALSFLC